MSDSDVAYLAASRHARSLRHLNVSRVCGLFPDDDFAVSTSALLAALPCFGQLSVIHLQQNQLTDTRCAALCSAVRHWTTLQSLNLADNILGTDSVVALIQQCARVPSVRTLRLPYAHNMLEGANLLAVARRQFEARVRRELKLLGREDIEVDIHNLAYAILANV